MRNSLRTRLTFLFILLAVVPLLTVGTFSIWRGFIDGQRLAIELQSEIAQRVGTEIDNFIRERENELRALAEIRGIWRLPLDEQSHLLAGLLSWRSSYESLTLVDNTGQELLRQTRLDVTSTVTLDNRSGSPEFEEPKRTGQIYFGPIEFVEATGEPVMTISLPLVDLQTGELQTILIASFRFKTVWDLVRDANTNEAGTVYVLDKNNQVVAHQNPSDVLRGLIFTPSTPGLQRGLDGEWAILSTFPLQFGDQSFTVVSERPVSSALSAAINTVTITVITIAMALMVAIVVGRGYVRRIIAPVERLASTAQAVAAGDLSQEVTVTSGDEIGVLADSFNQMVVQLRDLIDTLESRVKERTRDLELAGEVGRTISELRDLDNLLSQAVELIRARFALYYAQIYLVNPTADTLILQAGTGEVGKTLLGQNHRFPIGLSSINGTAVIQKHPVIVSDTAANPNFRPNRLLPFTRSEVAIPLIAANTVIGVLDLQNDKPDTFSVDNLPAFEAMASQLAVAIHNANLFAQIQMVHSELEEQTRRLTRGGWENFLDAIERQEFLGYRYQANQLDVLTKPLTSPTHQGNVLNSYISIAGEPVGIIQLEGNLEQIWTPGDTELISTVAQQIGQQVENLRLLAEAERYRTQAEEATRRLIREGWISYESELSLMGYQYELNREVMPLTEPESQPLPVSSSYPLLVRGEPIGQLDVETADLTDESIHEVATAVASQLSAHIENLRLTEQTERALAETRVLYKVSQSLTGAANSQELIENLLTTLNQNGIAISATSLTLLTFESNEATKPEWAKIESSWYSEDRPTNFPVGTRFPLSAFPTSKLWIDNPFEPVFIPNIATDPQLDEQTRQIYLQSGTQAGLLMPLWLSNHWVGLLTINWASSQTFPELDRRIYRALMNQIATILENRQLFEQTQRALADSLLLYQISTRFNTAISLESLVEIVASVNQASSGSFFSLDLDANGQPEWLTVRAIWVARGTPSAKIGDRWPLQTFPSAQLWINDPETPLLCSEVATDHKVDEAARAVYERMGVRSLIFLPLKIGKRWVGLISLLWGKPQQFDTRQEQLYRTLSAQAAAAVENILLFTEAQERAHHEQVLREISAKVYSAVDAESILRTAAQEVGRVLGVEAFVYLNDYSTDDNQPAVEKNGTQV